MTEYIELKEAIETLRDVYEREFPTADGAFDLYATRIIPRALKNISTADVAPVRRGEWIEIETPHIERVFECSLCEQRVWGVHDKMPYCAGCGAKMDLGGAYNET